LHLIGSLLLPQGHLHISVDEFVLHVVDSMNFNGERRAGGAIVVDHHVASDHELLASRPLLNSGVEANRAGVIVVVTLDEHRDGGLR